MLQFLSSRIAYEIAHARVLLIDDDPDIRTVTSLTLLTGGVASVEEAAGGREGIDRATQLIPDLILLDLKLPDISGEDVLKRLQADDRTKGIPVILFTACTNRSHLRCLPVAEIILKPFQPQALCEAVSRVLKTSRLADEGLPGSSPNSVLGRQWLMLAHHSAQA